MNKSPILSAFLTLATGIGACSSEVPTDPETRQACIALQQKFHDDLAGVYAHSREANCSPQIGNAFYVLSGTHRQYAGKCRQAPGVARDRAMFVAVQEDLERRGCIKVTP